MDKRRMCPHCRAFITTDDRVCPYCDTEVGMRAIDRQMAADAMAGVLQGDRFLTMLILVINIVGGFVIGDGARVGSNAVVLKPVPPGATAVGIPARIIERDAATEAKSALKQEFSAYGIMMKTIMDERYAIAMP